MMAASGRRLGSGTILRRTFEEKAMTRLSDFVAGRSMSQFYDAFWVPSVLDVYARQLAGHVNQGDCVLDLACGTGLVTGYAAERAGSGGKVTGYDPTPDLLNAARAKTFSGAPISWIEGFGEDMPFESATFDVVLCHQGLQYVTDRETAFAEIKRVLRPGGVFHAGVWASAADQPAFGFVEESLAKHFGPKEKPVHAWSFGGLPELKRLAEEAGFSIERLEKLECPSRFDSIQRFVDVQVAGAGRTDENGRLVLGLVNLEDENWLPAIDAFSADAHTALAPYAADGVLVAPYASDEMSAMA
jgi:ubiquinone/menaquinone biosynthesis C-methylase UbiE